MRIFANCSEAIAELCRDLMEMGVYVAVERFQDRDVKGLREYETKEIIGYSFCILDTSDKDKLIEYMKLDTLEWCKAEFAERVSGKYINPGASWKLRPEIWKEFLHDYGGRKKFAYHYSERITPQIENVIAELKKNPSSRQCVISIFNPSIDNKKIGKDRVPCSLCYSFIIRNGKLDLIYNLRSCDLLTHFSDDIWLAIAMQEHVAEKTGVEKGKLIVFISSLHAYRKNLESRGIF